MKKWRRAAALVLLVLAGVYLASSWYLVSQATKSERTLPEITPAEVGLVYETVAFSPRGWDFELQGWYIDPHPEGQTVVLLHGLDSNKASTGVGALEIARDLVDEGFNPLLFDFRAQGESEGDLMSAGYFEQDDLLGALDFLEREKGVSSECVGVLGFSFGAAVALLTAADGSDVSGVVADSGFADISDLLVRETASRTGFPEFVTELLVPGMRLMGRLAYGIDINAIAPEGAVAKLPFPILVMHGEDDDRVPPDHATRLAAASTHPDTELWLVPSVEHARLYRADPTEYIRRVTDYFEAQLEPQCGS